MKDCLFCNIVDGEIPSHKIYEDDDVFAFLDIEPLTEGHTIVVPKEHRENIIDLPQINIEPLFSAVKSITSLLKNVLQPSGFTIGINHGKISGQSVDHLHVHIIPRYDGDGGGSIHSVVHYPPKQTVEETKKKILDKK